MATASNGTARTAVGDTYRRAGLRPGPVLVHSAFSLLHSCFATPAALVQSLVDHGCTVVVPTFSEQYAVAAPEGHRVARNGIEYDTPTPGGGGADRARVGVYAPSSTVTSPDLGVVPATVAATPGRVRTDHPLSSFSALGPLQDELTQDELSVWDPLRWIVERDGQVLLLGCGYRSATMIHLAEELDGRRMFRRWAQGSDGTVREVEVGPCSGGFWKFRQVLDPVAVRFELGDARCRLLGARELVELAAAAIDADPGITHCEQPDCIRCADMAAGGPELTVRW